MRVAECWTDHRLVQSALSLHIAPLHGKQPRNVRKSFNICRLQDPGQVQCFQVVLNEKLSSNLLLVGTCSEKWMQFKDVIKQTATTVLGLKTLAHQHWFDENHKTISAALHAKNKAYADWQNDPSSISKKDKFKHLKCKVQVEL